MSIESTISHFDYEQQKYSFATELLPQALRLILTNMSTGKCFDRVIVKQTIPREVKPQITNLQKLYKCFINRDDYKINVNELKVVIEVNKNKNRKESVEFSLIQVKLQVNQQDGPYILHQIREDKNIEEDHQQRIRELEKLVLKLISDHPDSSIKNQHQINSQFLEKSVKEYVKSTCQTQIKKSHEIMFNNSIHQMKQVQKQISQTKNNLQTRIWKEKKLFLDVQSNYSKQLSEVQKEVFQWKQKYGKLEQQWNQERKRIIALEHQISMLRKQTSERDQLISGYNCRKRIFYDSSEEPEGEDSLFVGEPQKKNLIDLRSEYLKEFEVRGNVVKYVGENRVGTQILLDKKIVNGESESIKIKIVKSENGFIKFGVIDRSYFKDRSSWSKRSPRCIVYSGKSGDIYQSGNFIKSEGIGIRSGSTIEMKINLSYGLIQWSCEGFQAEIRSQLIQQTGIDWAGVVQMSYTGDVIQLIE